MKTKVTKTQWEEIERMVQAKVREHELSRIPTVECKYGEIIITFNVFDDDSWKKDRKIKDLLQLMDIKSSGSLMSAGEPFYRFIKGENQKLAEFLRKFISNGYVLKLDEVRNG